MNDDLFNLDFLEKIRTYKYDNFIYEDDKYKIIIDNKKSRYIIFDLLNYNNDHYIMFINNDDIIGYCHCYISDGYKKIDKFIVFDDKMKSYDLYKRYINNDFEKLWWTTVLFFEDINKFIDIIKGDSSEQTHAIRSIKSEIKFLYPYMNIDKLAIFHSVLELYKLKIKIYYMPTFEVVRKIERY